MSLFLDSTELGILTGKKHAKRQKEVLSHMGVHYIERPDGSLVVLATHVQDVLSGPTGSLKKRIKVHEPKLEHV